MDDYSILSEHMAPPKSVQNSNSTGYQPSDQDKKDIKMVDTLFAKAKRYKNQYDSKWLEWYKMFRGRQWKEQRPTYRHSEVLNLLFQTIQSQVPIITDIRPRFEFLPQEPQDFQVSEILNDVAASDWNKRNWMYQLCEVIYEGYFYGTGISKLEFDPKNNQIQYESADPFYLFPDPDATDVNSKSDYIIYAEPMELAKIKAKWPENGRYVKADLIDLLKGSKTDLGPIRYKSATDNRTLVEGDSPTAVDTIGKDKALVFTLWCKSDEYEEYEETNHNPETGESFQVTMEKLKYPNGKKIVVASGVVLESGTNPYDHAEFPYQRWQNYILPREFWGMSEIEQLEGPQKTFNKIISFVLDCLTLMGNPIWVVDNTSGIDTDNLINRPGSVVEKEPNSQVQRVEGTQLQPYVLQIIDRYKEWFDQIAGSQDVSRGVNPGGVTAASAIADLQQAAQTRIRQKSRNLDCYLEQLGDQYVSLVFQFYTAPQIFRLTGKDGVDKYFKFHVDPEQDQVYIENFGPTGLSMGVDQYQIRGKFDVKVTTGSSLPFSQAQKEDRLTKLFQLGIIDGEEVLKGLDYPNYEAVLSRMQQKQAQMAQDQRNVATHAPAA